MTQNYWMYFWNTVGGIGQAVFFSRFFVQWYATEKKKQVVVPNAFWWLSIIGTILLLLYSIFYVQKTIVILGFAFSWIPYVRNLIINRRHQDAHLDCTGCGTSCAPNFNFCPACGTKLTVPTPNVSK